MNFISPALAGMESPTLNPEVQPATDSPAELSGDRQGGPTGGERMSDEQRDQAAYRAGCAMQAWYSQYQHSGDTQHLERAYHCLGLMKTLLAGRSAEYVRQLEQERGLA